MIYYLDVKDPNNHHIEHLECEPHYSRFAADYARYLIQLNHPEYQIIIREDVSQ